MPDDLSRAWRTFYRRELIGVYSPQDPTLAALPHSSRPNVVAALGADGSVYLHALQSIMRGAPLSVYRT